ncbi:hypothetical protein E2C01_013945 [Portunus trituberculatus]|uniref:Uncharacterized protein n=1 Tax=Portunus trituberculatus TaxID=210409 RepID=A0A5B7DIR6_PORTR|nr:hypothetical protein [Portunus trituberculatus]
MHVCTWDTCTWPPPRRTPHTAVRHSSHTEIPVCVLSSNLRLLLTELESVVSCLAFCGTTRSSHLLAPPQTSAVLTPRDFPAVSPLSPAPFKIMDIQISPSAMWMWIGVVAFPKSSSS